MHPCGKNEDAYTLVPQAPGIDVPAPKQIEFQEPTPPLPQEMDTQGWSTGLCSCFDDVGLCFLTWCCPCVTFGRIAEIVDRGSTSCGTSGATYAILRYMTGCSCLLGSYYRTRLRTDYSLQKGTCPDFVVYCCCELCALCQEHRELKNRGFNMALGWHANVKMSSEGLTQPPPVAETRGADGAPYTMVDCLIGCTCIYSCFYQRRLRRYYSLPESPCCEGCALCLEYREPKDHGFDINIDY